MSSLPYRTALIIGAGTGISAFNKVSGKRASLKQGRITWGALPGTLLGSTTVMPLVEGLDSTHSSCSRRRRGAENHRLMRTG